MQALISHKHITVVSAAPGRRPGCVPALRTRGVAVALHPRLPWLAHPASSLLALAVVHYVVVLADCSFFLLSHISTSQGWLQQCRPAAARRTPCAHDGHPSPWQHSAPRRAARRAAIHIRYFFVGGRGGSERRRRRRRARRRRRHGGCGGHVRGARASGRRPGAARPLVCLILDKNKYNESMLFTDFFSFLFLFSFEYVHQPVLSTEPFAPHDQHSHSRHPRLFFFFFFFFFFSSSSSSSSSSAPSSPSRSLSSSSFPKQRPVGEEATRRPAQRPHGGTER